MADIIGVFPAHIALDDRNNIVREAEALVYAVTDESFTTPLPITDVQGIPFTGGKLVASNYQYPQFRPPAGITQVYVKSGASVTMLTDVSVFANATQESATLAAASAATASTAAGAAEQARLLAVGAAGTATSAAERAEAVGDTTDAQMTAIQANDESAFAQAQRDKIGAVSEQAVSVGLDAANIPGLVINAVAAEDIPAKVGEAIASSPTVVQQVQNAAGPAVDAALAGRSVVTFGNVLGTADLDTIIAPGEYGQAVAANATLERHYPLANEPGTLTVATTGGESRIQQFVPSWGSSQGRVTWQRTRTTAAAGYGPWNAMAARRVSSALGKVETWDDVQKRWQLDATSDTGWRSLASTFVNGWTGIVHIRRRGYLVTLRIRNLAGGTAAAVCPVPAGFGTNQSGTAQRPVQTSSPAWPATLTIGADLGLSTGLSIPDTFQEFTWETTAAWPSEFPGAALGTIPNS